MPQCRLCLIAFAICFAVRVCDGQSSSFRPDQRLWWTESRVHGTPDPPDPYRLEVAFPQLTFNSPIDIAAVPGSNRMAVVEHRAGISTFSVDSSTDSRRTMYQAPANTELIAVAFHPDFRRNGFAFFTSIDSSGVHLNRIRCSHPTGAPRADAGSREVIYSWPSGGHTGGCIRFGPDGYLYVATGDGSGHSDTNQYSQNISDPRGSILRLDVDHRADGQLYSIPPDNPFVDFKGARAEIYAYGLRQPWKLSFDADGHLWAGEVGQDLWEMVYIIQKGGNYGWSITEGSHPFRPERKQGPTAIVPPIVEHDHNQFRSITGGHVYAGQRLSELRGAYIYGDFDTGRIWALRYDGKNVSEHRQLANSRRRVVGFGQDDQGEVYVLGYASGKIYRLARQPAAPTRTDFPRKLSETGLFESVAEHRPAVGLIPYSLNAPKYADGATIERYLGLPGDSQIEFDALLYPRGPGAAPGWRFPDGTVLMQTFTLQLDDGPPRRLETRLLHHERMSGDDDEYGTQVWHGYTYVWNDEQTDAVLADAEGFERTLMVRDRITGQRQQRTWRFPSRTECAVCHNIAGKHVLGVNTIQMNREHDYGTEVANQLTVFDRLRLFSDRLDASPETLPTIADYHDDSAPLDQRARSYLHANCAHCHRQWGGGNANFQIMANLPIEETGLIDARPTHGTFGISDGRIIAPAEPYRSMLLYRMANIGSAGMPRLGRSTVDPDGLRLIHDWIANMSEAVSSPLDALPEPLLRARPTQASRTALDEWLVDTPKALRLVRAIDDAEVSREMIELIIAQGTQATNPAVVDLFERYLSEEKRTKRLGNRVDPDSIFSLTGDAERGRRLFFESTNLQCHNCHQVRGQGTNVGPDLSQIGKQYNRFQILDSIVNPSREIKPEYLVQLVETVDGQVLSGIRIPDTGDDGDDSDDESNDDIVLKDAENKVTRIRADQVEQIVAQTTSLMPDSLVRAMTAQQLADLIAYLSELK